MVQKLESMHLNPVKRGYVDEPIHWRWSSARNYAGMLGLIEVKTTWWKDAAETRQSLEEGGYEAGAS